MAEFVEKVLDETGNYYLLAWRPDNEEQKRGKFNQIEASIIDRPDLTVRLAHYLLQDGPVADTVVEEKVGQRSRRRRARTTCAWSSTRRFRKLRYPPCWN